MTTFQDPQPQSRRAVRQSERGESAESTVGFPEFSATSEPAPVQPAAPQFFDQDAPREMWDTTSRRAAQLPPAAHQEPAAPTSGRRAAAAPQATAEPLTYATQSKPGAPSYDGPSFRARPVPEQAASDELPPTQAIPQVDQPTYRVRDFSPESRRAAPATAAAWQATVPATDLDYQTQAKPVVSAVPPAIAPAPVEQVQPAPVLPAPVQPVQVAAERPQEHTLSRREMRAMMQAQEGVALQSAPAEPVAPVYQPPVQPIVESAAYQVPVTVPEPAQPVVDPHEASVFPFLLAGTGTADAAVAAEAVVAEPVAAEPIVQPTAAEQLFDFGRAPEPSTNTALTNAIAEFDALTAVPSSRFPPSRLPSSGHPSTSLPLAPSTMRPPASGPLP